MDQHSRAARSLGATRGRRRQAWSLRMVGLGLALLLGACATQAPPSAALPPGSIEGAGDPTRAAIITTAYVFGSPAILANQPGEAALAVARLEYLSVEIPTGARWRDFNPMAGLLLQQGAGKARAALAVAPEAPPQAVIDGLFASQRALLTGNQAAAQAALNPAVFTLGGAETLARLANLPPMPEANSGALLAMREMTRRDFAWPWR